ncbi:MAG: hypothetical protein MI725_13810, partial [Pirellulales bacterium]|nr:hypothetical protein [Pirellulales bacterium]
PQLQQRALDLRINTAGLRNELFGANQHEAQLLYHAASNMRLPSFNQSSPFGAEQTHLRLSRQALLTGDFQRRHLVARLARGDVADIVVGGQHLSLASHTNMRQILQTVQELPHPAYAVRTLSKQPSVARVYRTEDATTIALMNESPWPVQIRLPLESPQQCRWHKLGTTGASDTEAPGKQSGLLPAELQEWSVELKPYDLQAWQFDTPKVRVSEPLIAFDGMVLEDLRQRIQQIEARTANLDIQRPYLQLQNPGFELQDGSLRIVGWQPRLGASGDVGLLESSAYQGERALRLKSNDALGVAVQSHLFPMPETGQLVVSAFLRAPQWEKEARLHIVIEDSNMGQTYRQFTSLGAEKPIDGDWARYDFPIDDLPLNTKEKLRIQFHLTGQAEVHVDDVGLCDLRFDEGLRGALVKRIFAAKVALEHGHVVDCLQVVDEYWSRYLVEHVPPLEADRINVAAQPSVEEEPAEPETGKRFGDRFKGLVPKIWR